MKSESNNKRLTKKYHCEKCSTFFKKLTKNNDKFVDCTFCDWMAEEISNKEYLKLKKRNETNKALGNIFLNVNSSQNKSRVRVFSNSNVNINNNELPFNYLYNSDDNSNLSTNFSRDMNQISSNLNNFSNQGNIVSNNMSNINQILSYRIPINNSFSNQSNINYFPFSEFNNLFVNRNLINPFRENISAINLNNNLFEQEFFSFRSNEEKEKEIGVSKSTYEKLKKFEVNETYCNKGKDGKIEKPNCIICIADMEINTKGLLIPCGHMFHESCIKEWLEKNSTCPICKFKLPAS